MNDIIVNKNNNELYINYFGKLYKDNSKNVGIRFGYTNNWDNSNEKSMTKTDRGFETTINLLPNYDVINFCFFNEKAEWDNNNTTNFSVNLKNENSSYYIKDSGLLLISEVQNKVFLPYTAKEVLELLESNENEYRSVEEVIENEYIKPFEYYKFPFMSRFKETVKLVTKREKMSLKDGIDLGTELCKKRYLHPAIISACKNLDELNVYLDCLDKNELDDFKVFNIKYEMLPMVINEEKNIYTNMINIIENLKSFFSKREKVKDSIDLK